MGRKTARRLATDPNMVHTEVVRKFNGDVSMEGTGDTGSFSSVSANGTASVVKFDDYLAFTSAVLKVTSTSNSPTSAKLLRGGTTVTAITGGITADSTSSTSQNLHSTVLRQPTYSVQAVGGTITGTVTVTREKRL